MAEEIETVEMRNNSNNREYVLEAVSKKQGKLLEFQKNKESFWSLQMKSFMMIERLSWLL